jgi:hypothetical protein
VAPCALQLPGGDVIVLVRVASIPYSSVHGMCVFHTFLSAVLWVQMPTMPLRRQLFSDEMYDQIPNTQL